MLKHAIAWSGLGLLGLGICFACSANSSKQSLARGSGADGGSGNIGAGSSTGGTTIITTGGNGNGASGPIDDPTTCEDAAANNSYVGCDFWPTVVYNPVYSVFDFAAVVANAGTTPADVTVTRGTMSVTVTVAPGGLQEIKLPWVKELKGADFDSVTQGSRPTTSVRADGGAYHMTSTVPVTAWQFSPLQYLKDTAELAKEGRTCTYPPNKSNGDGVNCLSVSADATLLIPATALTGDYRVTSKSALPIGMVGSGVSDAAGGFTITGTQPGTHVKVQLSDDLAAGTGIAGGKKGDVVEFDINAGDVLELLSQSAPFAGMPHSDVSGSIVNATKPVQLIGFNPLTTVPSVAVPQPGSCCADHLEEVVLPAQVLGMDYLVAAPSTHKGANPAGHYVRFFGNFDGTTLNYRGTPPAGAPTTLSAGQIVEVDATAGFEVVGDKSFALTSLMKEATVQNGCLEMGGADCDIGDSSMSDEVAVEQYRKDYIFLAPTDFAFNWADVMVPTGANVTLDGAPLVGTKEMVTADWSVMRVQLMAGTTMGAHKLSSDMPVGLQVMGFGHATSYYYPGGLNLKVISDPPVVK